MKRTSAPTLAARTRCRSASSSSLTPRMTTRVELEPGPAARADRRDALEHPGVRVAAGQRLEAVRAQGVEADRDAGGAPPRGARPPARPAARRWWSWPGRAMPRLGREQAHEPVEVAAEQRLAAGEAHLVHAERRRRRRRGGPSPRRSGRRRAAARRTPPRACSSWQRRLQRSVTDSRRLRSGRSSVSRITAAPRTRRRPRPRPGSSRS